MEHVLSFFLLIAAGKIMQRFPLFPKDTAHSLNLYVIYIALPALILVQVPRLDLSEDLVVSVLSPWLVVLFSGALVWVAGKVMSWPRDITGALLLMVPLGNTAFLGIPMVEIFFGSKGVPYAILYDQFGSFLALSTYGTLIIALYSGGAKTSLSLIVKKIIFFPPFIALIAALLLGSVALPEWLDSLLEMTAGSLIPVVMVAIGFQLHLTMPSSEWRPLIIGLMFRLILTPLIFLLGSIALGLSGMGAQVSLLETAMPPMVAAGALASVAGLRPRLTAAMVGFGILFSFLTLPAMHYLIRMTIASSG